MNSNVKLAIIYKWIKRYTQLYFNTEDKTTEIAGAIETVETADLEELKTRNKRSNKQPTSFFINIVIIRVGLFHVWKYLVFTFLKEDFDKV